MGNYFVFDENRSFLKLVEIKKH